MYVHEVSEIKTGNPADEQTYEVYEQNGDTKGRWIGRIARTGGGWVASRHSKADGHRMKVLYRVVALPPGVEWDEGDRYGTIEEACDAVVDAITSNGRHVRGDDGLSRFEKDLLDFQEMTFIHDGNRTLAIEDLFGIDKGRYNQLLIALLERPESLVYKPVVVNRLRRTLANAAARRARGYRIPAS